VRALGARLLVMGHRRVGKSAAIVRFTTGRFIENYCALTADWLYRHSLALDEHQTSAPNWVELLEQRDEDCCLQTAGQVGAPEQQTSLGQQATTLTLCERVAKDKLHDQTNQQRHQFGLKLDWANAFVVLYSIDDAHSFAKAAKYLEALARHQSHPSGTASQAEGPKGARQQQPFGMRKKLKSKSSNGSLNCHSQPGQNNSNNISHHSNNISHHSNDNNNGFINNGKTETEQTRGADDAQLEAAHSLAYGQTVSASRAGGQQSNNFGNLLLNQRASANSPLGSNSSSSSSPTSLSSAGFSSPVAVFAAGSGALKPVLLLGNKHDCASLGKRRVSVEQARCLAARHNCLFAEISVKFQSAKQMEHILANLLAQINPHHFSLGSGPLDSSCSWAAGSSWAASQQNQSLEDRLRRRGAQLTQWSAAQAESQPSRSREAARRGAPSQTGGGPILATIMRTVLPQMALQSHGLAQTGPTFCPPAPVCSAASTPTAKGRLRSTCSTVNEVLEVQLARAEPATSGAPTAAVAEPLVARPLVQRRPQTRRGAVQESRPLAQRRPQPVAARRLGSFRSSFRKASLAIVGGRALSSALGGAPKTSQSSEQLAGQPEAGQPVSGGQPGPLVSASNSECSLAGGQPLGSGERASLGSCCEASRSLASGQQSQTTGHSRPCSTSTSGSTCSLAAGGSLPRAQTGGRAASWLRSRVKLGPSRSVQPAPEKAPPAPPWPPGEAGSGSGPRQASHSSSSSNLAHSAAHWSSVKFYKRPLFRYAARRETLALDRWPAGKENSPAAPLGLPPHHQRHFRQPLGLAGVPTSCVSATDLAEGALGLGESARQSLATLASSCSELDGRPASGTPVEPCASAGLEQRPGSSPAASQARGELASRTEAAPVDCERPQLEQCYNANRRSSGRLSSCLSTGDGFYATGSLFVVCNPGGSSADKQARDSQCNGQLASASANAPTGRLDRAAPSPTSSGSLSLWSGNSNSTASNTSNQSGHNRRPARPEPSGSASKQSSLSAQPSRASTSSIGCSNEAYSSDDELIRPHSSVGDQAGGSPNQSTNQQQQQLPPNPKPDWHNGQQSGQGYQARVVPLAPVLQFRARVESIGPAQVGGLCSRDSHSDDGAHQRAPMGPNGRSIKSTSGIAGKLQLVKTVQSTLNHLTRSTANSGAQMAKKSFCNALFRYSAPVVEKNQQTTKDDLSTDHHHT